MYDDLADKKVIVTGAVKGIGASIFRSLVHEGAFPIGIDIVPYDKSELRDSWNPKSGAGVLYQADITDSKHIEEIMAKYSTIDGLVNNAAICGQDYMHGGRTIQSFDRIMKNNAISHGLLIELIRGKMSEGSSIVNIGSIESQMQQPGTVLYAAAKGALLSITTAYANELAPKTRVNAVSPGSVETEETIKAYQGSPTIQALLDSFNARCPLQRGITPQEVANTVLFLLSNQSSGLNGANLIIDGGYTTALWDPGWNIGDLRMVQDRARKELSEE